MILIHVDPLTFKYGAQTMIFWSRALLRLFLQCFFKMAVLYCLNDNLSSKMNFQHFNIHRLQMQTQKKTDPRQKKMDEIVLYLVHGGGGDLFWFFFIGQ